MKLASAERGDLGKDYSETHPQKRPNTGMRAAGCGKCPVPGSQAALSWGTAGKAGLQPPPQCDLPAPHGLSQVQSEVTGCAQQTSSKSTGELWHCRAVDWLWHRCSCPQQCVQRGSCHHKARSCTTSSVCTGGHADWWTNLPHPPSQVTDAWREGWPRGAAWKAP